jgi:hypothetical protein
LASLDPSIVEPPTPCDSPVRGFRT